MPRGDFKVTKEPSALSVNGEFTPALPAMVFMTPEDSSNMRIVRWPVSVMNNLLAV